jgi:hypothetical protein
MTGKARKRHHLRLARTQLLLAVLAAGAGLACIRPVDVRSAAMAHAANQADQGRVCEAALAVVKEEATAPEGRRAMQSEPAYARVRGAWR